MTLGAAIYGYRNNFSGRKPKGKPKKNKAEVILLDLLRPGAKSISKYEEDYWVTICQFFMRKGYPGKLTITYPGDCGIEKFLLDVLFSVEPWLRENLWINKEKFDLIEFREQFDILVPITLDGLDFYKDRPSTPIPRFEDFHGIKSKILYFVNGHKKLKYQFNSCHTGANTIFGANIEVKKSSFVYGLTYGYPEDLKPGGSCWSIFIHSEENENYLDFCIRIFDNFDRIISGDFDILKPKYAHSQTDFYLEDN